MEDDLSSYEGGRCIRIGDATPEERAEFNRIGKENSQALEEWLKSWNSDDRTRLSVQSLNAG
jgi:hypothetical protein